MLILLYLLLILIMLHNVLVIVGLSRVRMKPLVLLSIVEAAAMFLVASTSFATRNWLLLVWGFCVYRLAVMVELVGTAWYFTRKPSPLIWVNGMIVLIAGLSILTKSLWVFGIGYLLFWTLSYLTGRKQFQTASNPKNVNS
ncbi:hypothetical protein [Pontibacter sp. G13]|uniref:hypothetical protein n=1 Tax=Pontibacter sp. G13 TaxID=3074898 RepID=UPI002889275C|nr:hypothetical protein [Pontibacter sp. G13]WNJ18102.1 hypothetical protein RJD25_24870 [Pontibacter sp. G13]